MKTYLKNLSSLAAAVGRHPDLVFLHALAKQFPKAEVYLVGGAVRDAALGGKNHKDYDFVVRNVKPNDLESFLKTQGTVKLVGKMFGVFKFIRHPPPHPNNPNDPNNLNYPSPLEPIDIALPRREKSRSGSGAYRDFEVQSDPYLPIEQDLARRDFTINAMALRITPPPSPPFQGGDKGKVILIDPSHGLQDIANKTIRAVGKPEERFQEDYTRLLRAVRFACQLNFKIEAKTWKAIKTLAPHLNDTCPSLPSLQALPSSRSGGYTVPRETIGKEMAQAFFYNPVMAFDLLDTSGLTAILMPEVSNMKNCPQPQEYHIEGDVWTHTRLALKALDSSAFKREFRNDHEVNSSLIIATLLHDIGKPLTIKTPKKDGSDRIRFDGHDTEGALLAKRLGERLKLSQFPKGSPLHVDIDEVAWLIKHHLLTVTGNVEVMKPSTLEKYFFKNPERGLNLLKLFFVDGQASILPNKKSTLTLFRKMRKKLKDLEKFLTTASSKSKKPGLPLPLLTGHEVMKTLNIFSGPKVGTALAILREAQLEGKIKTKEQAKRFLISELVKLGASEIVK